MTPNDIAAPPADKPSPDADPGADVGDDSPDVAPSGSLDYSTVRTGRRCATQSDCPEGLSCDTTVIGRICTNTRCIQGPRASEERQCGGRGSTCLLVGSNGTDRIDFCLRGCVARATTEPLGACGEGFVCTTNWMRQLGPEASPGCLPFCTTDEHCTYVATTDGRPARCHPRVGFCLTDAPSMSLRPDGSPCDPSMRDVPQCRGTCFGVNFMARTQGICGSLIDVFRTRDCPDYGRTEMLPVGMVGDNLARCVYKRCDTNAQCLAPLRCLYEEDGSGGILPGLPSVCLYPTPGQPNGIPVAEDAGARADAD